MNGDRPECPENPAHKIHKHGGYHRHCDPAGNNVEDKEWVQRFLCTVCKWTIGVLPDNQLPYRSIDSTRLAVWLNWKFQGGPEPPQAGEKEKGCMQRAVECFVRCSPSLIDSLAQIIGDVCTNDRSLWQVLASLGDMVKILRFLREKLKPEKAKNRTLCGYSLLGRYRCLSARRFSSG